jgi:hypothetical protein
MVKGVLPEEEKVEQEVLGCPQAPSCEELNPTLEQGVTPYFHQRINPRVIYFNK